MRRGVVLLLWCLFLLPGCPTPTIIDDPSPTPGESPTPTGDDDTTETATPPETTPTPPLEATPTPPEAATPTPPGETTPTPPLEATPTPPVDETPTPVDETPTPPVDETPTPAPDIDLDHDGFAADVDCNDEDAAIYPGAREVCNGIDDDCDDRIDEDLPQITYYPDRDGDGYGQQDPTRPPLTGCGVPKGYTTTAGDCDDWNQAVYPGAPEACNEIDDDCNGATDDKDFDEDDHIDAGCIKGDDCDDTSPEIYPGAPEVCDNADNDCDGVVDARDLDGDGYTASVCSGGEDCDDGNAAIHPNATEVCNDRDDDCDQSTDEGVTVTYYKDGDRDGYGDPATATKGCTAPTGYVKDGTDCNDTAASINPAVAELCGDGIDNNCDGASCRLSGTVSVGKAEAVLTGERDYDSAGFSVSPAGDVNNDGFDDLLVGAPGPAMGGQSTSPGYAYLFYGPVSGTIRLSLADAMLAGEASFDQAGYSVAPAGDVNNDGYDDLVVGAPGNDAGGTDAGAVYFLLGPLKGTLDLTLDAQKLVGEGAGAKAGFAVAPAGDVNLDGYDDVLVGSPGYSSDRGRAYLLYGSRSGLQLLKDAAGKLTGEDVGDKLGWSVAAGDINRDRRPDLVFGAPLRAEGGAGSGVVYVLQTFSLETLFGFDTYKLIGEDPGDQAGFSVAVAGDVDGDGFRDIVVGAPYAEVTDSEAGMAYLVSGPLSATLDLAKADALMVGPKTSFRLGISVASAGDVDHDGYADLLVGTQAKNTAETGTAYLIYGPPSHGMLVAGATIVGKDSGDMAGYSVASAGDVDGDDFPDILVGAPWDENTSTVPRGAAYLIAAPGL